MAYAQVPTWGGYPAKGLAGTGDALCRGAGCLGRLVVWTDFAGRYLVEDAGHRNPLGAIEYWAKMYKINIGTEELRWPVWVQETFDVKDRVQRWLVLLMLPVGLALLSFRSLQAMVQILMGQREMVIASHEAEELVEENKDALKELD